METLAWTALLNTLEENLRRNPRYDHRNNDRAFRRKCKGPGRSHQKAFCVVSANSYYVRALADNYKPGRFRA